MDHTDTEAGAGYLARTDAATAAKLRTHSSSLIARMLEYQLVGAIGADLLACGETFEVLKSDVDADGYDLVIEANGIVRHIQLKAKVLGGRARKVSCHTRLQTKPSGCIIVITYDPATYLAVEYACFGGGAGEALPDIGSAVARRSTHNKGGERPLRADHRDIRLARFSSIRSIPELVEWLFCPRGSSLLDGHPFSTAMASEGGWSVFPLGINHTDGTALVVLAKHGTQEVSKPPYEISISVDLIGRRWRVGSDLDDNPQVQAVLSQAAELLSLSLDRELLEKGHS